MAKKAKNQETDMTDETEVTEAKQDKRSLTVTLADGSTMKRAEYIRQRWSQDRASRSEIAKELSELTGKEVKYQIVFAATKGVEGGPVKAATDESEAA